MLGTTGRISQVHRQPCPVLTAEHVDQTGAGVRHPGALGMGGLILPIRAHTGFAQGQANASSPQTGRHELRTHLVGCKPRQALQLLREKPSSQVAVAPNAHAQHRRVRAGPQRCSGRPSQSAGLSLSGFGLQKGLHLQINLGLLGPFDRIGIGRTRGLACRRRQTALQIRHMGQCLYLHQVDGRRPDLSLDPSAATGQDPTKNHLSRGHPLHGCRAFAM